MSETSNDSPMPDDDGPGISDDQLPEDLQPTDDNPLAKNPDEESGAESSIGGGVSPEDAESTPPPPDA